MPVDISHKPSPFSFRNRAGRALWSVVYAFLFRPSPRPLHAWRRMLLSLFGARLGKGAKVFSSAKIYAPWNLIMGDYSTIAPDVDCYNAGVVHIGSHSTISQYSYLCSASHDYEKSNMPLEAGSIVIGSQVWIASDVFVGPNVEIGEGSVVGARSSVFRSLPEWKICLGTPARPVRSREIKGALRELEGTKEQ